MWFEGCSSTEDLTGFNEESRSGKGVNQYVFTRKEQCNLHGAFNLSKPPNSVSKALGLTYSEAIVGYLQRRNEKISRNFLGVIFPKEFPGPGAAQGRNGQRLAAAYFEERAFICNAEEPC